MGHRTTYPALNKLSEKAKAIKKKINRDKITPVQKFFIIETKVNNRLSMEVLNCTGKELSEKIKEGRIDKREKIFEAELTPVSHKHINTVYGI